MALLTLPELQAAFETDLPQAALQLYLDDAEAQIIARVGDVSAPFSEHLAGAAPHVFLSRRAVTVVSVADVWGNTSTPLVAVTDYVIRHGGRTLERIGGAYFAPWVDVVYTAAPDLARRKRVQLDLVKLAVTFRGTIKTETSGDYTADASRLETYEQERESLLSALALGLGVVC